MVCYVVHFDVSFGTVYLMYVQIILSSIKVLEWPPFGKKLLPWLTVHVCSLYIMSICCFSCFPFLFRGQFWF